MTVAEGGRVLYAPVPRHKCSPPANALPDGRVSPEPLSNGTIWQCDCGSVYRYRRRLVRAGAGNVRLRSRRLQRAVTLGDDATRGG